MDLAPFIKTEFIIILHKDFVNLILPRILIRDLTAMRKKTVVFFCECVIITKSVP